MRAEKQNIEILDRYPVVAPFLTSVIRAADGDRNALGFFPSSVFDNFARKEQLLVATSQLDETPHYAGHLLFEAKHPKASILQMFVAPAFRKLGVATKLLDQLKKHLIDHAFISLYARVAEDLLDANRYWHAQGFYVQRITAGGEKRKRTILVRSHELDTPQLFAPSGLSGSDPLGLDSTRNVEIPLFLLDLNVLFDLGPRRLRNEDVLDLFRSERQGYFKLALSNEISAELRRTASVGITDPMHAYARIFPTFPCPLDAEAKRLEQELGSIVFPNLQSARMLTSNDISDLRHLATAVHHRLAGFVTNDMAILQCATLLKARFGIQIVSPAAFKESNLLGTGEEVFETGSSDTLSLAPITRSEDSFVHDLLSKLEVSGSAIVSKWAAIDTNDRVCDRQGVWCHDALVGYLMWPRVMSGSAVSARVAVDESQPNALNVARVLLRYLIDRASSNGAIHIRLEFPPRQVRIREVASELGFGGLPDQAALSKLVLGRIIAESNWNACKDELLAISGLRLPDCAPFFRSVDQQIRLVRPDGNVVHVPLMALETLLAPGLFCLSGRPAIISPVRRDYSEHLLAHLPQKSLLPLASATLFSEKHYLAGSATLKQFQRGNLILFYESMKNGGLGAVVAIARVQHAYLKSQKAMEKADLDPSVLDAAGLEAIGLSKNKTVAAFDNLISFKHPVPLSKLQQFGCGAATDLITTRPINDSQLQAILEEGFGYG